MIKLNELVDKRGFSQIEVADVTDMAQFKVLQVGRYNLLQTLLERLIQALVSLDQNVEIDLCPARRTHSAGLTVNLA